MSDDSKVKHRKVISSGQLGILKLLYRYRFGSIELLRISLGLNEGPGLYKKLEILCDEGYVGKRYESSYRIQGIPAAYYLLTRGFRELQKLPEYQSINERLIKYSPSKDKIVTRPFITDVLNLYRASIELERLYPQIKFFTKRELAHRKHFPEKLPDGFVSLKHEGHDKPRRYFIDFVPDSKQRNDIDKKVADNYDFFEEGGWAGTKSPLPVMLLLCESGSTEKRIQRWVARKQHALDSDEPNYFTSTLTGLRRATPDSKAIWSSVEEPDELYALDAIS